MLNVDRTIVRLYLLLLVRS